MAQLFSFELADRDGRSIFPIRRGAALVPEEPAHRTELRHDERAFLILPLVMAGSRQRLGWLWLVGFLFHVL